MTTYTNFTPSTSTAFQFQPTLDGQVYNAIITWSIFGQRYYLNLYALDGTLILCTALIGSPTGFELSSLTWNQGVVTAATTIPHGLKIGTVVSLTIAGVTPAAYNGLIQAVITGPQSFTYKLTSDPGAVTIFGATNYNINLIGGVPNVNGVPFQSTLVFRQQSQQFEQTP